MMIALFFALVAASALAEPVREKVACDSSGDVFPYSATLIKDSTEIFFSSLTGKVSVFIPSTNYDVRSRAEFLRVKVLALQFPEVSFFMFSTSQFNYEEVFTKPGEFFNVLKHVRPGAGFEPPSNMKFFLTKPINGAAGQPVFTKYLTAACEYTRAEFRTDLTYQDIYAHDVRNPFEAFLVGKDGKAIYRYDITSDPDLAADIQAALE